jgi:site-specific recombinase XerD
MFDRLFQLPGTVARHRNGPLAEERLRYLVHCAGQRLARGSLRNIALYTLTIAQRLRLAERRGELIARAEIEAEADRWVKQARRRPRRPIRCTAVRRHFVGNAVRWLTFLGRLQTPRPAPQPYADLVTRFADYLLGERGLARSTIAYGRRTVQAFLTQAHAAGLRLQTLTVAQVDELLLQKVQGEGYARRTIRTWVSALCPFFRFAHEQRWCRRELAMVRAPRVYTHEGLPLGPSWDDVQRLLAAAEGDRLVDIRDRALLMLLAVYGLRSSEVVRLRLEDFDWQRERLTVPQGKRPQPRTYPLCRPVGDAVLRYLRVRPRSERREVFLILVAPFRPLTTSGLRAIVACRLHALGLTLPHYGPHVLRHACASHLLAQGLSLKEIGDHLGHQSLQSTRVYAKVDLASLRVVGDLDLEGLL